MPRAGKAKALPDCLRATPLKRPPKAPPPKTNAPCNAPDWPHLPFVSFIHYYPTHMAPGSMTAATPLPYGEGYHYAFGDIYGVAQVAMIAPVTHMQEKYASLWRQQNPDYQPMPVPPVYEDMNDTQQERTP